MKRVLIFMLTIFMMLCLVSCAEDNPLNTGNDTQPATGSSEESDNATKERVAVFDTENIKRITLITKYGYGEKHDVPVEDMAEMTAWLDTFTLGEILRDDIPVAPGNNTVFVEIEYADGTVIKNGLDTINVDGVRYYMESDPYPECYCELLSIPMLP